MGRTTRWLKGIFGMKNSTKLNQNELIGIVNSNSGDRKITSFGNSGSDSGNNPPTVPPNLSPSEAAAWLRSYYLELDKEQSKHAIVVAAATAAAADAAVAAAQAAVAVVRLTRHSYVFAAGGSGGRERWAAVKIQTSFRGYLARKALRALKGIVKIQALVRGYLIRKQATATLLGMQALIRAQATVRSKRAQVQVSKPSRSMKEIYDDTSEHKASIHSKRLSASSFESRNINATIEDIPKIVEVDPGRPRSSKGWPRPEYGEPSPFYPTRPENEWGLMGDHEYWASTAQSTPRFMNTGGPTPSKSICGDNNYNFFGQYGNYHIANPNYMANTMSFRAKMRSQSVPKQRLEVENSKKRLSLNEMMESRNSLSGVGMQRSCCHVQEAISFKNAVMSKLDRSYHEFGNGREVEKRKY